MAHISEAVVKSWFYPFSKARWGVGRGHCSPGPPAFWADGVRNSSPEKPGDGSCARKSPLGTTQRRLGKRVLMSTTRHKYHSNYLGGPRTPVLWREGGLGIGGERETLTALREPTVWGEGTDL